MDAGEIGQLARPRQGADETFHLRILVNDPAVLDDGNAGEGVFHRPADSVAAKSVVPKSVVQCVFRLGRR
jgi:hypothetical protein